MSYKIVINNDSLTHHGILGQRWGIRRFQNYDGTRIKSSKTDDKSDEKKKKGLSDKQKRALKIGAISAGAALAVIGGVYLYKSGKLDDLINKGKTLVEAKSSDLKIDNVKTNYVDEKIVKHAKEVNNKLLHNGEKDFCTNIFLQMEAEARGFSCEAKPITNNSDRNIFNVLKCFNNDVDVDIKTPSSKFLNNNPETWFLKHIGNNTTGYIQGNIESISGKIEPHAFRFEVKDNKLNAYDGINGENAIKYFSRLVDVKTSNGLSTTGIFRTDNLSLNLDVLDTRVTRK